MKNELLAGRYVKALAGSLSKETIVDGLTQLQTVATAINSNTELLGALESPFVNQDDKMSFIKGLCESANLCSEIQNLLSILTLKGRLNLLQEMEAIAFNELQTINNTVDAVIESRTELDTTQKETIIHYLNDATNRTINANFIENKTILAGFKASVGNKAYDATLDNSLTKLESAIKQINLV